MPESTNQPPTSRTGSNFYQKYRVQHVARSTSVHGTPSTTSPLSPCRNPSVPRIPYAPHSIRESDSYGPRIQKYDEYINIFCVSDDSDNDISSRKKDHNQEKLAKSTKYELETTIGKTITGPTNTPNKPIIRCYNAEITNKDIMSTPLTSKKSAPIKKISFVLPGCKKPLESEHMDWKDFHKLNVIYQFMDDLEANFPSICTTTTIGTSVEGRDIKILKISNSNASNVGVWIDAGIHAREWIAPAVNTYIANHIIRNFDNLPESVRNKDWYFLPIANPDGYHYSHSINRMWRKNRALHNGIRSGVDLNRNFWYFTEYFYHNNNRLGWGRRGSSDKPHNAFYKGPHPFSEPESSAIRDMLLSSGINFKVYITLHCYGQVIIFPYSFTSEMAPDYVRLLEGATAMSKAIYNTNGNTYKVGVSKDVMYSASGTSNDFAHGSAGIPFCYLIELRSKKHKFRLPKEQIEETGNEILNSVLALMEHIDTYAYTDRIEQNIDLILENDSFLKSSIVDNSDRKILSDHKKSKHSHAKKIDSSNDSQGSFVRLTHYPGERDDPREETGDSEWSDSLENVHESFLKNNPANKDRSTKIQHLTDSFDSKTLSALENNYTSRKNTAPYEKVNGHLPDSFENGNESFLKKKCTSGKETNPSMKNNEYLPDSFKNGNESVLKKKYTSEKGTNPYMEYNEYLPDSFNNGNESVLKKKYASEKGTNPYIEDEYLPDSLDNRNESVLKKNYTSDKETNPSMEYNEYLPDSFNNGNESVLKKKYASEKGTNPYIELNEYLPDSLDNGNESVLNKNFTSEMETNTKYKKVNQRLLDFLHDEKEYHRNKTNTSEKETVPYKEDNQYYPDSIDTRDESVLLRDDVSYGSKQKTVPFEKVNQYLPRSSDIGNKPVLKMKYPSEQEINRIKKINEYLPDFFNDAKSDLKKICTSERRTNLNNKINQYLESDLKKIYTPNEKPISFKKVIQYFPDSFDGEKESNLNKINASEKDTNTSEKEYLYDSNDSLLFHSDLFKNKAVSTKVASDATGCCVDETKSLTVKQDSYEAWNSFYEQKSIFDTMRSKLLLKTATTFVTTDIRWDNNQTPMGGMKL